MNVNPNWEQRYLNELWETPRPQTMKRIERMKQIIECLKVKPMTTRELSEKINQSHTVTYDCICSLRNLGVIEKAGKMDYYKGQLWELVE